MANRTIKACGIFLFLIVLPVDLSAEYIFLKEGPVIKGRVITEMPGYAVFRDINGNTKTYQRRDILRIQYGELFMGRQFVKTRSGNDFEGHIVAETRTTYTFRKNLNVNKEFTLEKRMVLYMVRLNAEGLKGKAKRESISLEWLAPYRKPDHYRIYIRKTKNDEWDLAKKTRSISTAITGLKGNTEYRFIVRSVDSTGHETIPSNELVLSTTNTNPSRPGRLTIVSEDSAARTGKDLLNLTWGKSTDSDGTVIKYRITRKDGKEEKVLSEVNDTSATVLLNKEKKVELSVYALDNTGGISKKRTASYYFRQPYDRDFAVAAGASILIPVGNLAEINKMLVGGAVRFSWHPLSLKGFGFQVRAGFYGGMPSSEAVEDYMMLPVDLHLAWRFYPVKNFHISAYAGGGYVMKRSVTQYNTVVGHMPSVSAGVRLEYIFKPFISIYLEGDFTWLAVTGFYGYAGVALGASYRF